jgi:hypothetical protein
MEITARRVSVASVIAATVIGLAAGSAALAQARDPLMGTWKLNRAKSSFNPGPAPVSRTMKFEPAAGDGVRHHIETYVNNGSGTDEGVHITQYTAAFDGKDNAIQGSALDTVSLKRLNPRSIERTGKVAGAAIETQTWNVSADGKVLTVTTKGSNDDGNYGRVEVFEKQ